METSQKHEKRWFILSVMCIVLFIIAIDNTVLNLALPSIAQAFEATASQLQWVVDAYTLIFASLLITTGTIGDRYGRKRSLIIGLVFFGLGSLGAALSTSIIMLICFRAFLGLAGSLVMPSTLSILIDVFKDGKERARAIAFWSSIFSIGAGIGPLIGGFLINSFHWSSVFFLNVPIVVIGIVGGILLVPESYDPKTPKPDFPGVILSITGLITLVYGMIRAGEIGWTSGPVLLTFVVSAIFLVAFIWWENHSPNPMLPLVFFKNMAFTGANAGLTISAFAMMGSIYFFSQFFQSVQGYSPIMAAICQLPMSITVFVTTMGSVRVDRKMGTKFTMSLGLLLSGCGLFLFSQVAAIDTSYWLIVMALILLGWGIGFTMSPATSSIMNSLPPNRAGIGSAMNDTTRQLGGALGIAVLGSLMNGTYRVKVNQLLGTAGISNSMMALIRGSVQSAHLGAQQLSGELSNVIVTVSSQAFVDGMKEALFVGAIAMVFAALSAWTILPKKEEALKLTHQDVTKK